MNRPRTQYDALSRVFHWLTAAAVLAAFVLGPEHFGREMHQGLDPATRLDIVLHESLGVLILVLSLLRLLWVAIRPAKPQFEMPPWMDTASKAAHGLLWMLLLAVPLSALLALGSEGHPLSLLSSMRLTDGPLTVPFPLGEWAAAVDWGDVHGVLADMMVWLAGLHAAAALLHHFVLKDGVLRAMWKA